MSLPSDDVRTRAPLFVPSKLALTPVLDVAPLMALARAVRSVVLVTLAVTVCAPAVELPVSENDTVPAALSVLRRDALLAVALMPKAAPALLIDEAMARASSPALQAIGAVVPEVLLSVRVVSAAMPLVAVMSVSAASMVPMIEPAADSVLLPSEVVRASVIEET